MLRITVQTTPTTAIVSFQHPHPERIARYEAYLHGHRENECFVAGSAQHLQCTIEGIPEASDFAILARACYSIPYNCENYILNPYRTTIRRKHYHYV